MLGAGGVAFAAVAVAAPARLPAAAVALWLVTTVAVSRPLYFATDAVALGGVVGLAVAIRGEPVPFAPTATLVLVGTLALGQALRRDRAGLVRAVGGVEQADAVLVDLRERARSHAGLSELPAGWHVESDLRPAHGETFGGDFLVAALRDGGRLDLALVDVSGKGGAAGGRALLFTGAFGALLETLPRAEFLSAANRYVLRHGGEEGFATAVHASVDLAAGTYAVSVAGHPPPALFRAGSGRWELVDGASGPLLGVVPDAGYGECRGRLAPGDALLLYTDGMVESPRLDVVRGIDRLLGFADPVVSRGTSGGAALIVEASRAAESDDGALVVIRRTLT